MTPYEHYDWRRKLQEPDGFKPRDPRLLVLAIVLIAIAGLLAWCGKAYAQDRDGQTSPTAAAPSLAAPTAARGSASAPSRYFHLAAISYSGLALTDVIQSQRALASGKFYEVNRLTYGSGGALRMSLTKGLATGGVLWTAYTIRSKHPKVATWLITGFLIGQSAVVIHNARVMR